MADTKRAAAHRSPGPEGGVAAYRRTPEREQTIFFERSEFLIATSQKKRLRVCACVRLILVLVSGWQTVYGQNTVYLCLSKYIVFENTHTHSNLRVTTAASETEGVAAVSWIVSHD